MSDNPNLNLWNSVCDPNPDHVHPADNGKYKFSTVDPQYIIQQATALWGPYGHHWGLKNMVWSMMETQHKGRDRSGNVYDDTAHSLVLTCDFFYPVYAKDGVSSVTVTFPIAADMKFRAGDDCYKKLQTAATKKAMSKIGFAASIYLGMFDDEDYVKDLRIQFKGEDETKAEIHKEILKCKTLTRLAKVEARVIDMTGNDTISPQLGRWLLEEVEVQRSKLEESEQ